MSIPDGVWQGTLGGQPIRACTVQREWGAFGAYYYDRHLKTIALDRSHIDGTVLVEGSAHDAKKPRWHLDRIGSQGLEGQWRQAGRSLPIRLTRLAGEIGEDGPCASLLFNQPRLAGIRALDARAVRDGVAYTKLTLNHRGRFHDVSVETFSLGGNSPVIQRINARLRKVLDTASDDGWFACVRMGLGANGNEGYFHESFEPRLFVGRWLIVGKSWDVFCGGAHPDHNQQSLTFDLQTGREVDLHDWLSDQSFRRDGELRPIAFSFRKFLLAGWRHENSECVDAVGREDHWDLELTRRGIIFTPELPHVVQACADPIAIDFDRLAPFVSPIGRANIAAFRAQLKDANTGGR